MNFLDTIRSKPQVIPANLLGDVVQLWEFFQRFHKVLQITRDFTLNQLYDAIKSKTKCTDLLDLLISSLLQYTFEELVLQKSHNANYYSLLEQVQSLALRKFLIYKSWPLFFTSLNKITKMRYVLQDDIKEEYLTYCKILQEQPFQDCAPEIKCKFALFLIDWIVYEIEAFGTDLNEVNDMLDLVKVSQSDKQKKSWQVQLQKSQSLIQQHTDQIRKEKRKSKKNKKLIDQLEVEMEDFKTQHRKFTKLLDFDPKQQDNNSKCQHVGSHDGINVWYMDQDKNHFYLRTTDKDLDLWYQISSDQIQTFINEIGDDEHSTLKQSLRQLVQDKMFNLKPQPLVHVSQQYFSFGSEIEVLLENKFNLDFLKLEENDSELLQKIRQILLQIEDDYSCYEIEYWRCCWQSREKRQMWRERVEEVDDLFDLQIIVSKFPHQLSFVNKKHALTTQPDEESKYRSFRLYWFYCNKLYSQPYQLLSKGLPDLQMMFVLSVTLYEKLKFYTNKKILQIELKQIKQNFSSANESKEELPQQSESKSEEVQLTNRLRSRNNGVVYDEKKIFLDSSSKKTQKKVIKSDVSTPNISFKELEDYKYSGDRQLRSRKKVKYN